MIGDKRTTGRKGTTTESAQTAMQNEESLRAAGQGPTRGGMSRIPNLGLTSGRDKNKSGRAKSGGEGGSREESKRVVSLLLEGRAI